MLSLSAINGRRTIILLILSQIELRPNIISFKQYCFVSTKCKNCICRLTIV